MLLNPLIGTLWFLLVATGEAIVADPASLAAVPPDAVAELKAEDLGEDSAAATSADPANEGEDLVEEEQEAEGGESDDRQDCDGGCEAEEEDADSADLFDAEDEGYEGDDEDSEDDETASWDGDRGAAGGEPVFLEEEEEERADESSGPPSSSAACTAPAGPNFLQDFGACTKGKVQYCRSVCDCGGMCACNDEVCKKQCPEIQHEANSAPRRRVGSWGHSFTVRRRQCPSKHPNSRRRSCKPIAIRNYKKQIRRPIDCDKDMVAGITGRALNGTSCRVDEAMCLRWNVTSVSFWVWGLARIDGKQEACIGLNTQFLTPASYFSLSWVSLPGRYFLGALGLRDSGDRAMPPLPWRMLSPLTPPVEEGTWRSMKRCCTWLDPMRELRPHCEVKGLCVFQNGVSTSTCQYELCSVGDNSAKPECTGSLNPRDEVCLCRNSDQDQSSKIQ